MWMSGEPPTEAEAESMLPLLQRACLECAASCHHLSAGGGPSLRSDLRAASQRVLEACIALVKSLGPQGDERSRRHSIGPLLPRKRASCVLSK